jgi:hypothetical protein
MLDVMNSTRGPNKGYGEAIITNTQQHAKEFFKWFFVFRLLLVQTNVGQLSKYFQYPLVPIF